MDETKRQIEKRNILNDDDSQKLLETHSKPQVFAIKKEQRVRFAYELLVIAESEGEIARKISMTFGVTTRTGEDDIAKAKERLRNVTHEMNASARERLEKVYWVIIQKAIEAGRYNWADSATAHLAQLLGANAPVETNHNLTGKLDLADYWDKINADTKATIEEFRE